ncbi:NarK/NasA family nitrate transporter [Leptospira semungkisensis]|uniref:NarK/NasA family nitrate transporter n=1 Tax=Leptospira semungkisensis TaxID=2484985 RepID=A0A4V3JCT3_9LEPT|nr:MFS transporter [Leptospira semungkisensis]TGK07309.1 NarK/NasA family nitrate transporter [Leptospira semungkisensis]
MKKFREFLAVGHFPSLLSSFLYFDFSFMVWMLLAALSVFITEEFGLGPAQKGMLVSIPLLGGTLLRIPMGLLSDRFGSRIVGLCGMAVTMVTLVLGWQFANTLPLVLLIGLLLGSAGASFAVALPLASRWYPKEYQGLVMGIAGAGNSGSVLATLFAPDLARSFGWHFVFALALIPMSFAFVFFLTFAKDCPGTTSKKPLLQYLAPIRSRDALLFCLLYSVTFGGFVGLTSFLPIFFHDQYYVDKVTTGLYTSYCIFGASLVRPVGGYLADQFGGVPILLFVFGGVATCLLAISWLPGIVFILPIFIILMVFLGIGNGSVFQLVPMRFRKEIGIITGFIGAFGGLGGFLVPNLLGGMKAVSGSFSFGFVVLAIVVTIAALLLFVMNTFVWEKAEDSRLLELESA